MFTLEPHAIESLTALMIGIAFAGLLASTFELFTERRASFKLLQGGDLIALTCVPVVVFSAPFIILRNTVRAKRFEARPLFFVFAATFIACGWALLCGRVVLDVAHRFIG